jgi:DNA-binding MarR family transcriptional regulator
MAQYAVLRALADHPDASAAELARLCFVTRQSLQDVLRVLRSAELIVPADTRPGGRARALQLSALGERRLKASHAAIASVESAMTQGISASTREELSQLLTVCAQNLEAL